MQRQFEKLFLGSVELFCMAAESGSFTAAATAASVTPAAVSRAVAALERRLDIRLFVRTTRKIRLTESGNRYFEQCRQALIKLADAERQATRQQTTLAGTLRVSMPTPYGHYRILPILVAFRRLYPNVSVEAHLCNSNVDLADGGYDVAIRGREPRDSGLIARKLEDMELVTVASPTYLRKAAKLEEPEDLTNHDCIQFELPSNGRNIPWEFTRNGNPVEILTRGGFESSGDALAGVTLARHGAGVFQTYRFIVEKDIEEGVLEEVLTPYGGRSRPFILLYPHRPHVSSPLRSFVDFVVERLQGTRAPIHSKPKIPKIIAGRPG
jgi:DNA-binding transcriptional LysR family regulator